MAIVKYKNQSGITYAYESTSIWDPAKKQSRPKRKYLGRVDEKTGEIVSTTGKRGRPRKNAMHEETPELAAIPNAVDQEQHQRVLSTLAQANKAIARLENENTVLLQQNMQLKKLLCSISKNIESALNG